MTISSQQELEKLFANNHCKIELNEDSYSKTRYINQFLFDHLIKYELNFEPYTEIAKRCSMSSIQLMRSTATNRFYIGFVNLGGHGARYEVRPVRLSEVEYHLYIERMFADYAKELDWGISLNEDYEI